MATQNYTHPLPSPPSQGPQQRYQTSYQQPVQPQEYVHRQDHYQSQHRPSQPSQDATQRPRRGSKSRAFSFRSDRSRKSAEGSGIHKVTSRDTHETSAEKESKRLHSKADPTLAMNEAEPSAVAQSAATSASLRSIQHRDYSGSPIVEPDRSNPTRSKWERPLDTIRSFEAAIDGSHNRQSMYRSDSESINRRGSYYGNNAPRFPQDSYYGGRPDSSFRPQSGMFDPRDPRASMMMAGPRDSYYEGFDGAYPPASGNDRRNKSSRMQSEPPSMMGRGGIDKNVYPSPNNHRSYETVASGSGGSGSYHEPAGYQTDPTSSENSSINRLSPPKRHEPVDDYGISFAKTDATTSYQPPSFSNPSSQPRTMPTMPTAPPAASRKGTGLGGGSLLRKTSNMSGASTARPEAGEKRKSWLSRKFSKA